MFWVHDDVCVVSAPVVFHFVNVPSSVLQAVFIFFFFLSLLSKEGHDDNWCVARAL